MNNFFNHLKILEIDLYEYRFIVLEYIYGKFIFLINDYNELVFFNNDNIKKSKFFIELFKMNKYYIRIPNYIKLYKKYIYFIELLKCKPVFFFNFLKDLTYIEFLELIDFLSYLDLLKNDKTQTLRFYKELIEISYNFKISNYNNVKIKYLLHCNNL